MRRVKWWERRVARLLRAANAMADGGGARWEGEPGASSDTGGAGASGPEKGWFDHGLCGGLNVWA
jgi:hypothetical protein